MNTFKQLKIILIFFFLLISTNIVNAQSDWEYNASIYGWAAGIDGTVGVAVLEQQVDATPSDLLKHLQFTMGGHFEARDPVVSLILDVFYMGLNQETQVEQTIRNTTITKTGSLDLKEWVVEGAIGYRISKTFEMILASRFYQMDVDISIDDLDISKQKKWFDVFIGARYKTDFAEKWFTSVRADLGYGGSDFAWFGNAELGYNFSKLFALAISYRILSVDFQDGSGKDYFLYDTFNHGFGLAAVFNF
jgi:hypothetical protein